MSARFLLDTNVLSEPLKPTPDPAVLERLDRHADRLVTASVVWHELAFGVSRLPRGRRRALGERFLRSVVGENIPVLPYDVAAASWHAQERARLEAAGHPASFADGQVAAVAAVHGLTLVTANTRDFAAFRDLRVERWHA